MFVGAAVSNYLIFVCRYTMYTLVCSTKSTICRKDSIHLGFDLAAGWMNATYDIFSVDFSP